MFDIIKIFSFCPLRTCNKLSNHNYPIESVEHGNLFFLGISLPNNQILSFSVFVFLDTSNPYCTLRTMFCLYVWMKICSIDPCMLLFFHWPPYNFLTVVIGNNWLLFGHLVAKVGIVTFNLYICQVTVTEHLLCARQNGERIMAPLPVRHICGNEKDFFHANWHLVKDRSWKINMRK